MIVYERMYGYISTDWVLGGFFTSKSNLNLCISLPLQRQIPEKVIYDCSKMISKGRAPVHHLNPPPLPWPLLSYHRFLHCGQRSLSAPDLCRTIAPTTSEDWPWMHLVLLWKRSAFRERDWREGCGGWIFWHSWGEGSGGILGKREESREGRGLVSR